MKRVQLIETGIIIIALIFGYKFFESIFTALVQIFYSFEGMQDDILKMLVPTIFMIAIYAVCFVLLVKRSGQLATYLQGNENNDNIPIKIGKKSLLQVILISICIFTILANIPGMILYLVEAFKEKAGRYNPDNINNNSFQWHGFKVDAIQVIVAIVVIFFSKDITNWFLGKKETDELTFDSNPES
jgi:hypothetical protein